MKTTEDEQRHFFDVDHYSQYRRASTKSPTRPFTRLYRSLTSITELLTPFLGYIIMFGPMVWLLYIGLIYGAMAFYGGLGLMITLIVIFVEKKVGRTLRFEDYRLSIRLLGLTVSFILLVGILYLWIFLAA